MQMINTYHQRLMYGRQVKVSQIEYNCLVAKKKIYIEMSILNLEILLLVLYIFNSYTYQAVKLTDWTLISGL